MSDRAVFYLAVLVFLIGVVVLALGATAGSLVVTILGFVAWIIAAGLIVYWLLRHRQTA